MNGETPLLHTPSMKTKAIVAQGERVLMRVGNSVVGVAIMLVTPPIARAWLDKEHPNNRKTPTVTERYTKEMTAGGWRPTPEPIVFSATGVLINGGNRMRAIVASGTSALFTVWFDWPDDAFPCLDRGSTRSVFHGDAMTGQALPRPTYQMARSLLTIDTNNTVVPDTDVRTMALALLPAWTALGAGMQSLKIGRSHLRASAMLTMCVAWISDPDCVVFFLNEAIQASEHSAVPGSAVRNYLRWYAGAPMGGGYALRDAAYGTAAALRQYATKTDVAFLKPTAEAWEFWRRRSRVVETLDSNKSA